MKRKYFLVVLFLIFAMLLSGCGTNEIVPAPNDCNYGDIAITVNNCLCSGCEIGFQYLMGDCSKLDYYFIALYDIYPFTTSCDIPLNLIPAYACTGDDCPFFCGTACSTGAGVYYAVIDLFSNTGSKSTYYTKIEITGGASCGIDDCGIKVYQGYSTSSPTCIIWKNISSGILDICQ